MIKNMENNYVRLNENRLENGIRLTQISLPYSLELYERMLILTNSLGFKYKESKIVNTLEYVLEGKHAYISLTIWLHPESINYDYYFKNY